LLAAGHPAFGSVANRLEQDKFQSFSTAERILRQAPEEWKIESEHGLVE
jgi:hypothetical protein